MNDHIRSYLVHSAYSIIFLLILSACASVPTENAPEALNPNTLPSEEQLSATGNFDSFSPAALTAFAGEATVLHEGEVENVLNQNEMVIVPMGERIKLDPAGRGVLRFEDRHQVELFGGTDILLD